MDHAVANELVMRFYRATSLPVMEARRLLSSMPEDEQRKYTNAAENSGNGIINDPLEDDPEIGPIINSVLKAVARQVQDEHGAHIADLEQTSPAVASLFRSGRGLCHRIWHMAQKQLRDEHGIEWKTPAEMTPWIIID